MGQGDIELLHPQSLELSHDNFIPLPPSFAKFTYNLLDAVQFLSPPEILDNPGALSHSLFLSPLNIYLHLISILMNSIQLYWIVYPECKRHTTASTPLKKMSNTEMSMINSPLNQLYQAGALMNTSPLLQRMVFHLISSI